MRQYLNHFVGRVASFDNAIKYYPNEDEDKCLLVLTVNVQKPFKKKEEQYYPTFLKTFKAFGKTAKLAGEVIQKNMDIIAEGYLDLENDYTDEKSGELRKGREFINCKTLELINSFYSLNSSSTKIDDSAKSQKSSLKGLSNNKASGLKLNKSALKK